MKPKRIKRSHSAKTGRFVSKKFAKRHPATTVEIQHNPPRSPIAKAAAPKRASPGRRHGFMTGQRRHRG